MPLDVPVAGTDYAAQTRSVIRSLEPTAWEAMTDLLEAWGEVEQIEDPGDVRSLQSQRAGDLCVAFDSSVVQCPSQMVARASMIATWEGRPSGGEPSF